MQLQINDILWVPGVGSYYYEDIEYLQRYPLPLETRYLTPSTQKGFRFVREPSETLSLGLVLEDGRVAWGDCVSVVYGGKAGREAVFRVKEALPHLEPLRQFLTGRSFSDFRSSINLVEARFPGLQSALTYGLSQALLAAFAWIQNKTMAEIILEEWNLPLPNRLPKLHAQCGTDKYGAAVKMMVQKLDSLPHGLVDDIPQQLGQDGTVLLEYVTWLSRQLQTHHRSGSFSDADYFPTLHLDVHGSVGLIFDHELERVATYVLKLEKVAAPYPLRIESVGVRSTQEQQLSWMLALKETLKANGSSTRLVADEWANTLEDIRLFASTGAADMIQIKMPDLGAVQHSVDAVIACQKEGVDSFLGGTCNETVLSSTVSAHVSLATQPTVTMVKPGMGVDEAISLFRNEMNRGLKLMHQPKTQTKTQRRHP